MRGSSERSDRLLQGLLVWTALTTMVFWLPFVRGLFDGLSYEWGGFGFSGRGTAGDYWFVATASVLAIALQYLAWRGPRAPFYALFGGWHLYLAFTTAQAAISDPASLRFQGETLGVDVSFAVAAPVFMGIAAALAFFWMVLDALSGSPRPAWSAWTQRNTRWALALAALLPMQLVLLRVGEPHGTTDQIGVLVTIAQWFMLGFAVRLKPDPRAETVGRALA